MAIIIPSKHIYSKSFDSVVDNNINRIEVAVKSPQLVTDYHVAISNNDYIATSITYSTEDTDNDCKLPRILGGVDNYYVAVQYSSLQIGYLDNITITIPKNQTSKRVIGVYDKVNKEGNNNIGYTVNYLKKSFTITANATLFLRTSDKSCSLQSISVNSPNVTDTINESGIISDDNTVVYKNEITIPYATGQSVTLATNCQILNQSNISTATIIDNGITYSVTLKVLDYKKQYYVRYGNQYQWLDWQNDQTLNVVMNGNGEEYVPQSVSITIYGNTINLDLSDITSDVGSGNKVFSFDGNELMQTTNTPSIESKYQAVKDEWENGKQTATITCPITDYYDENDTKVIDISTNGKMLFGEGDIVIPYAYTNKGDKPIFYNKDFTPKQFRIVGTKISKTQGGIQELTLQEQEKVKAIAIIKIGGELSSSDKSAKYELYLISGILNVGETFEYAGELGQVTEYDEDLNIYTALLEKNGIIASTAGSQIIVQIK